MDNLEYFVLEIPENFLEERVKGSLNKVNFASNDGLAKVYVYGGTAEGPEPHCHVVRSGIKVGANDVCVRLDIADYFPHGKYKDKFTGKEKKIFDAFMRFVNPNNGTKSNWEVAVDLWNGLGGNSSNKKKIVSAIKQPDYTKLSTR